MKQLQAPNNGETTKNVQNPNNGDATTSNVSPSFVEDIDSACSTPFVSAPSSPGRNQTTVGGGGFFYSAPASPMHYLLSSSGLTASTPSSPQPEGSCEVFDFSANWYSTTRHMSSADELFLNGEIRPMKLSTHLQRPQKLAPLMDVDERESDGEEFSDDNDRNIVRGRAEVKLRSRSLRRIRSMSPLRSASEWREDEKDHGDSAVPKNEEKIDDVAARDAGAQLSGSSSVGRNSKRWVSLKEFLYRSKSEGRNNSRHKYFWSSLSFPKMSSATSSAANSPVSVKSNVKTKSPESGDGGNSVKKQHRSKVGTTAAADGKRRVALSAHEMHYTANRAAAEEMRKKTLLPYRQGLFGCIGLNSKSYGAMNSFAKALNSVSST